MRSAFRRRVHTYVDAKTTSQGSLTLYYVYSGFIISTETDLTLDIFLRHQRPEIPKDHSGKCHSFCSLEPEIEAQWINICVLQDKEQTVYSSKLYFHCFQSKILPVFLGLTCVHKQLIPQKQPRMVPVLQKKKKHLTFFL